MRRTLLCAAVLVCLSVLTPTVLGAVHGAGDVSAAATTPTPTLTPLLSKRIQMSQMATNATLAPNGTCGPLMVGGVDGVASGSCITSTVRFTDGETCKLNVRKSNTTGSSMQFVCTGGFLKPDYSVAPDGSCFVPIPPADYTDGTCSGNQLLTGASCQWAGVAGTAVAGYTTTHSCNNGVLSSQTADVNGNIVTSGAGERAGITLWAAALAAAVLINNKFIQA